VIRVVAFLLLVAAVACSSTREISVRASAIQEHATAIIRTTDQMDASSPQVQQIRTDAEAISASVGVIHREITAVADVVPWWATLIRYALVAAAIGGVCVLVWQTGIGVALRAAVGLIPRRVRTEAELAAATLDPAKAETVREWVSMRRATDPLFEASFQAAKDKTT
jgi:hypothetical protein